MLSPGYSNIKKRTHANRAHTQHPGYQMNRRLIKFLFASETMELQLNPFLIAVRKYNKLRRICMETNLRCCYMWLLLLHSTIYCVCVYTWVRERGWEGEGAFKGINYDIIHFYMHTVRHARAAARHLSLCVFWYFLCNQRKRNFCREIYDFIKKWIARFVVTKSTTRFGGACVRW